MLVDHGHWGLNPEPVCCRVDISDTLMYVYEMLGAELLSNLYDRLARLVLSPEQAAVWQVMGFSMHFSMLLHNVKWTVNS